MNRMLAHLDLFLSCWSDRDHRSPRQGRSQVAGVTH